MWLSLGSGVPRRWPKLLWARRAASRPVLFAAPLSPYRDAVKIVIMGTRNPQVDAFVNHLPGWQQEVCAKVRALIHEAEPEIQETIKRGDRPYFVLNGNVCAFQATKDHMNVFIYDPIAPDPERLINQGQGNATARSIQIYEGTPLKEQAFKDLIRAVAANNRRGGWRKLNNPKHQKLVTRKARK